MKKFFPVISILLGGYWVIYGFKYGFWVRKGPGGGFLPIIAGAFAVIFGIVVLISTIKDKSPNEFSLMAFLPVGAVIALILCSYILGLTISIAIYVFAWLKFIEKYTVLKSTITGFTCSVVIYLIFILWLRVPLPSGILGFI